jgi:hypothetical protein
VVIRVRRGRNFRYGVGVGVETGQVVDEQNTTGSTPQWDAHVLAFIEHRDFLGGLRRLRLEDRPRLIFQGQQGQSPSSSRASVTCCASSSASPRSSSRAPH